MVLLAALTVGAPPTTARAQTRIVDQGQFGILHRGRVIGREDFVIRAGRTSTGREGFTITSTASYPADGPKITLSPRVELGVDSLPLLIQIDVYGDGPQRVIAQFGRRRVTVRSVTPRGESAKEYPATGRQLVADDSVFALYAILPLGGKSPVSVIAPRVGTRSLLVLEDLGLERTAIGPEFAELRHVALRAAGADRHLWYDSDGRLMKVEIASTGLVAVRDPR